MPPDILKRGVIRYAQRAGWQEGRQAAEARGGSPRIGITVTQPRPAANAILHTGSRVLATLQGLPILLLLYEVGAAVAAAEAGAGAVAGAELVNYSPSSR